MNKVLCVIGAVILYPCVVALCFIVVAGLGLGCIFIITHTPWLAYILAAAFLGVCWFTGSKGMYECCRNYWGDE